LQHHAAAYAEQAQGMYVLLRGLCSVFAVDAAFHLGWVLGIFQSVALLIGSMVVGIAALVMLLLLAFAENLSDGNTMAELAQQQGEQEEAKAKREKAKAKREEEKAKRQQWHRAATAIGLLAAFLCLGIVLSRNHGDFALKRPSAAATKSSDSCCAGVALPCCPGAPLAVGPKETSSQSSGATPQFLELFLEMALVEVLLALRLYYGFKELAFVFAKNVYRDFLALGASGAGGNAGGQPSSATGDSDD